VRVHSETRGNPSVSCRYHAGVSRENGPQLTLRSSEALDSYLEVSGGSYLSEHLSMKEEKECQYYKEGDEDWPRMVMENSSCLFHCTRRESGNGVKQHSQYRSRDIHFC